MIRVLIVDDMETFRERFREVLTSDPSVEVVGLAASGEEAVALALAQRPDVILMDVIMEHDRAGIAAATRICAEHGTVKIAQGSLYMKRL